jgi:response regulator NasT
MIRTGSAARADKPSVLLVEDEPLVRFTLARGFEASGFEVFAADSIVAAKRLAQDVRPSVAIIDGVLPDGCGLDLAQVLRDSFCIPFILLTASACPELRTKAVSLGARAYVVKPVPVDEVVLAARAVTEVRARSSPLH